MTATSKAILSWTPLVAILVGAVLVYGADRQKNVNTAKRVDGVVEKQDDCESRLDANEKAVVEIRTDLKHIKATADKNADKLDAILERLPAR